MSPRKVGNSRVGGIVAGLAYASTVRSGRQRPGSGHYGAWQALQDKTRDAEEQSAAQEHGGLTSR